MTLSSGTASPTRRSFATRQIAPQIFGFAAIEHAPDQQSSSSQASDAMTPSLRSLSQAIRHSSSSKARVLAFSPRYPISAAAPIRPT